MCKNNLFSKCNQYDKAFAQPAGPSRHMNTHPGDKPFKYWQAICRHFGDKPFKCDQLIK